MLNKSMNRKSMNRKSMKKYYGGMNKPPRTETVKNTEEPVKENT